MGYRKRRSTDNNFAARLQGSNHLGNQRGGIAHRQTDQYPVAGAHADTFGMTQRVTPQRIKMMDTAAAERRRRAGRGYHDLPRLCLYGSAITAFSHLPAPEGFSCAYAQLLPSSWLNRRTHQRPRRKVLKHLQDAFCWRERRDQRRHKATVEDSKEHIHQVRAVRHRYQHHPTGFQTLPLPVIDIVLITLSFSAAGPHRRRCLHRRK